MSRRDPHTELLALELERRGYRIRWRHNWCFTATRNGRSEVFWSTRSSLNSQIASQVAKRKDICSRLLTDAGVSAPTERLFRASSASAAAEWASGRWPVVVKPATSPGHSTGATVGVTTADGVRTAVAKAARVSSLVLVQQQVRGSEARMLVVGGRCVHVLRKLGKPGAYEAITERVHPSYLRAAERAVAAIPGLGLAGLDVIAEDWHKPGKYAVIEVNSAPGIKGHHRPTKGRGFDAAGAIVDELERRT
ncbi:cyanophycin synthetase [Saccharomonospora phage PIS 136]|nr:cyanophycin synthetase [Saccharomonospora phage PIS 136]